MISSKKIAQAFLSISRSSSGESGVNSFIEVLKKKKLEWMFPKIIRELQYYENFLKLNVLGVESAYPLSNNEKKNLQEIFQSKKLKESVNKKLLSGVHISKNGVRYKFSVQARIQKLQERLLNLKD